MHPLEKRHQLRACLETLQEGDELVISKLDRLGRSQVEVINRLADLQEKGIHIRTLDGLINTRGRQITAFHTHLHLGALPDPLNHLWYLDHLIQQKVSPRVQNLLKTTSEGNRGVVIKPWNWDHHAFYNLKDYYRYKHHQDPDFVIDYQNSDLRF